MATSWTWRKLRDKWILNPVRKDAELVTACVALSVAPGTRAAMLTDLVAFVNAQPNLDAQASWSPPSGNGNGGTVKPKTWKCSCGQINPLSDIHCGKCGKKRKDEEAKKDKKKNDDKKSGFLRDFLDAFNGR